jgi:hypothetical protein
MALLLATASAESSRQQSWIDGKESLKTLEGINEVMGMNPIDTTGNDFLHVQHKIQNAVQDEKKAEQKALEAESLMRQASNAKQRKIAKKKLVKSQKQLKLAEHRLEEVQRVFGQSD